MMRSYTLQEWKDLRQAGHVVVNGVEFFLHVDGVRSDGDVKIPGTKYGLPSSTKWDDVFKAAGYGTYDWAKPQSFFDEYFIKYGEAPIGVWWYPLRDHPTHGGSWLSGRFVSKDEALKRLGEEIVKTQGDLAKV